MHAQNWFQIESMIHYGSAGISTPGKDEALIPRHLPGLCLSHCCDTATTISPLIKQGGYLLGQVVVAPDGCCLDAEGALWVADAVGGRVIRVFEGGTIEQEIDPGTGVFACMIGGRNHRTLFMCAAPDFQEEARKQEREGRLLAVDVEVARDGLP